MQGDVSVSSSFASTWVQRFEVHSGTRRLVSRVLELKFSLENMSLVTIFGHNNLGTLELLEAQMLQRQKRNLDLFGDNNDSKLLNGIFETLWCSRIALGALSLKLPLPHQQMKSWWLNKSYTTARGYFSCFFQMQSLLVDQWCSRNENLVRGELQNPSKFSSTCQLSRHGNWTRTEL